MKTAAATLFCVCLLGVTTARSDQRLTLRLTPPIDVAPAVLNIQATVEKDASNRMLEVVVESEDYLRSSQFNLDGDKAARTHQIVFRGLPVGRYAITATLSGDRGPRAIAQRWFQATGSGR